MRKMDEWESFLIIDKKFGENDGKIGDFINLRRL